MYKIFIEYEKHADVAKEHRVSKGIVEALAKKVRLNKKFIDELVAKRDEKTLRRKRIRDHIQQQIDNDVFIGSREDMRVSVEREISIDVKKTEIGDIMKNDLKMKFKKVKPMSVNANSEKNLVLR